MFDIVLCDDHPVFVDALGSVLSRHGFTVRAIVNSRARIVETVAAHRPDACVMDRNFGDGDGVELIRPVIEASPRTKVLVLTADPDVDTVLRALEAGASGYLCKTAGVAALLSALARMMNGEVVADPPARPMIRRTTAQVAAHRLADHLTRRERECLGLLVQGCDTPTMSRRLGVSTTTVRTYVQAVLTKLGVHSRLEAASFAVRHSLLDLAA